MMRRRVLSLLLIVLPLAPASASSLRGSHASMVRQNAVARRNDFTFLRTAKQIQRFVDDDRLIELKSTADYELADVSFPYARPVIELFIERLARQYHVATDHPLVITSLIRPTSEQPRNASPLSVHPAGMAVDLRIPDSDAERQWLEHTLLALEDRGVLDVTREQHPAHYHVAVFPEKYAAYAATLPPLPPAPVSPLPERVAATPTIARAARATSAPNPGVPLAPLYLSVGALLACLAGVRAIQLRRTRRRTG